MAIAALSMALVCLTGCKLTSYMMEQPSDRAKRLSGEQSGQPAGQSGQSTGQSAQPTGRSAQLEKKTETFTGKVVMVDGAYRLRLLRDPDKVLSLTRSRRESEFPEGRINLRKYYEKTISVNGTLYGDWIFGADIVGQWTPPGGETGPNMNAPKASRP